MSTADRARNSFRRFTNSGGGSPFTSGSGPAESTNLDVLRAAAVGLVFSSHLLRTFDLDSFWGLNASLLGLAGVLFFFVHTSLVLMRSLERTGTTLGAVMPSFYIRRAMRVYPLSLVCIGMTLLFNIPPSPFAAFHPPGLGQIASNALLVQNISGHDSLIGQLWSLPYEVQVYLMLPFAYVFVRTFRLPAVVMLVLGSMALAVLEKQATGHSAWFRYLPCFTGGMIAFALQRRRRLPAFCWLLSLGAFAATFARLGVALTQNPALHLVAAWSLPIFLGTAIPHFAEIQNGWLNRTSHTIAKYSYGIYLTHSVAMWVAFIVLAKSSAPVQWGTLTALAILLPWLCYHLVEAPATSFGRVAINHLKYARSAAQPVDALASRTVCTLGISGAVCGAEGDSPSVMNCR